VSLNLRNRDELEMLLADIQNPDSPNYHRFLTPEEFNSRYAPSTEAEQRVVDHLQANGLRVTQRFGNRLVVSATGSVAAIEHAFGVELHKVSFQGKSHYASVNEPAFPDDLAPHVVGVIGLDDLVAMHPHVRSTQSAAVPSAALGSYCCYLSPNDLKTFYGNDGVYDGTGQTMVIAGAYAWSDADVANFNAQWGLPSLPTGSGQVCTGSPTGAGCQVDFSSTNNSLEVTLDVEYAHGTATGARILNYMAASTSSTDFTTMYNVIVNNNPGHVVTTSWGSCEYWMSQATQLTNDNIFANANAIGQTWFAASGDNGSRDCGTSTITVDHPANSSHVIGVGGTTPVCSSGMTSTNPACAGYGSESGWSDSGGGVSQAFTWPSFQAGCGVPAGSQRLVPDVSIEANPSPGNLVLENGGWWVVGGTSDGAPQWAGIFSALKQKAGGSGLGNPGAGLYALCATSAFHDITTGSNGDYSAAAGYDMVTGLGSPDITNLLANFTAAVCGDGVVEPGEQCDDGNATSGDGCSATCQIESGWTCTGQPSACTVGACPANASGAPNCACNSGYTGTLTWNGSSWSGTCAANCGSSPTNPANGTYASCANTASGGTCALTCSSGYTKSGDALCTNGSWSTQTCSLAACPTNASGAPNCACDSGYTGTLTWDGSSWTDTCSLASCPANASGPPNCTCNSGYTGTLTWNGSSWSGTCAANCATSPSNPPNGTYASCANTASGGTCALSCNSGYSKSGDAVCTTAAGRRRPAA
jgi:cysteine-rich repeat protein